MRSYAFTCGHPLPAHGRGLCENCYHRWRYHGCPEDVPPAGAKRKWRLEDYAELRAWGETLECAALRLHISERTAWRYEAELKRMREASVAA